MRDWLGQWDYARIGKALMRVPVLAGLAILAIAIKVPAIIGGALAGRVSHSYGLAAGAAVLAGVIAMIIGLHLALKRLGIDLDRAFSWKGFRSIAPSKDGDKH